MKEFKLSDKINKTFHYKEWNIDVINIKEFIRLLKEGYDNDLKYYEEKISMHPYRKKEFRALIKYIKIFLKRIDNLTGDLK